MVTKHLVQMLSFGFSGRRTNEGSGIVEYYSGEA
jgi:hypothetical protein